MANSVDTYWDINGVSLQTLAYNISTSGETLQAPPPLRGEDIIIPYNPGARIQPRMPDSRTLVFNMWVQGSDTDGRVPTSASLRAEYEKNLKTLRNLFWNGGNPVTITKRWRDYGSSTIQTASATAIYADGFAPSMTGAARATFAVEMFLPDPFFYGNEVTVPFAATATSTQNITVLGDYETNRLKFRFNGARNNMRLTNVTAAHYVNINRSITSGSNIEINPEAWTAIQNPTTTPVNAIKDLTYFGHTFWLSLTPGAQILTLSSTTGTGSGVLTYRPRWV